MTPREIKRHVQKHGFVYTDIDTPDGRVRVTARGPRTPSTDGNGELSTVVKATRDGEIIDQRECTNHALAGRAYVELVQRFSS
jgi:hypothetical protein